MEDYPQNIIEFETRFSTEQTCREYLFQLRWPNGFQCPHCSGENAWPLKNGLYQCGKCDQKVSAISGTIFHGTHKQPVLWFRAIWWMLGQKVEPMLLVFKK